MKAPWWYAHRAYISVDKSGILDFLPWDASATLLGFPFDTDDDKLVFGKLKDWFFKDRYPRNASLDAVLNSMPADQVVATLQKWRVPYALAQGKPMDTVVHLINWLVDHTVFDRR